MTRAIAMREVPPGPVVVGGVGGSGTRVVAEILMALGVFMGWDLNAERDNLIYTLLFKRPRWFYRQRGRHGAIGVGIRLLQRLMTGGIPGSAPEWVFLAQATLSMAARGHNRNGDGRGTWALERVLALRQRDPADLASAVAWGWKEPNSFLLIGDLRAHFAGFRYIHVIRHGLDMAFSSNQQQLYNWGPLFGVPAPAAPVGEPPAALRYWVRANDHALEQGKVLGAERFLDLRFEHLITEPEHAVRDIVTFLGLEVEEVTVHRAVRVVRSPETVGRHRLHDLAQFSAEDLQRLFVYGYAEDRLGSDGSATAPKGRSAVKAYGSGHR